MFLPLNKINRLDRIKFCEKMEFSVGNLLMQNSGNMLITFQMRMHNTEGLGRLDSSRTLMGFFLPVYNSSYSLFESNWSHKLCYLFVLQISLSKILSS